MVVILEEWNLVILWKLWARLMFPTVKWPRTKVFMSWKLKKIQVCLFLFAEKIASKWKKRLFWTLLLKRGCHSIGEAMQTDLIIPSQYTPTATPPPSINIVFGFGKHEWVKQTNIGCGRERAGIFVRFVLFKNSSHSWNISVIILQKQRRQALLFSGLPWVQG